MVRRREWIVVGGKMRFLIEHRGHYGFLRLRPRYTLHLHLEFSDEERAIIRTRALQHYRFDLSPGFLGTSERRSRETLACLGLAGMALFLLGFLAIFASDAFTVLRPISILMIGGGTWLFWHAKLAWLRAKKGWIEELTVGELAGTPDLDIETRNPAQATTLEENIRSRLGKLKGFLTATHEMSTPRAFEL